MKNIFLILATLIFLIGCEENETQNQENGLLGTWKLTSFINESIDSITLESDFSDSNEITISFNNNSNFTGSTIINSFSGNYSYDERNNNLTFLSFSTTEVNENDWGNLFFDNLNINYNQQNNNWEYTYQIQDNILKIYYGGEEYMILEKL